MSFLPASLPPRPSLEFLRKQAKLLLRSHEQKSADAIRILARLKRFNGIALAAIASARVSLQEAQHALALHYEFSSWKELTDHVADLRSSSSPSASLDLAERIHRYLGAPVQAPPALDSKYSGAAMAAFVRQLLETAGYAIQEIRIDASEFPNLIGGVAKGKFGGPGLKELLKNCQNGDYVYGGEVGGSWGDGRYQFAINLVPDEIIDKSADFHRAHSRVGIRTQVFYAELGDIKI